jgi:hypothetical protein
MGTYDKETSGSMRGGEFLSNVTETVFAFKEGFCSMEF